MKNHESQHQKVQNKFTESISEPQNRSKEFCDASRMVIELANHLKIEKCHLIICELSESKTSGNFAGRKTNAAS